MPGDTYLVTHKLIPIPNLCIQHTLLPSWAKPGAPSWSKPWHTALILDPAWDQHPAGASAPSPSPGPRLHTPLPAGAGWEQHTLQRRAGTLLTCGQT